MASAENSESSSTPQLNKEFQLVMALVCEGIAEFRHYDLNRVAVSIGHSRGTGRYGVWAHVIPLRYVGGKAERRGRRWGLAGTYRYEHPKLQARHPDAHYVMTFLVPRFFSLRPRERLETIVHELYHIHPSMRGDLRRFNPPHVHHGPTPALYDRKVKSLTAEALRAFPSLLEHPLIAGDGREYASHRRLRLPRPLRVFRPAPGGLLGRLLLALALCAGLARSAAAAVFVRTLRSGSIYSEPSQRSQVMGAYAPGTRFEATRLSTNKIWVEVKGKAGQGWVPRRWIETLPSAPGDSPTAKSAPKGDGKVPVLGAEAELTDADFTAGAEAKKAKKLGTAAADESLEEFDANDKGDNALEEMQSGLKEFDSRADRFFSEKAGRLYEKPSTMAARYGVVEKNDEMRVLARSKDGRWAQVRLLITGEEGWYPMNWIRREKEARLGATGLNAVEGNFAWGSRGHNFGIGAGYFRNFMRGGLDGRPRDRFEVGGTLSYWLGESLTVDSKTAKTSAFQITAMGRYLASADSGKFSGGAELGVTYHKSSLSADGITDATIATNLAKLAASSTVGLHAGVVGIYSFKESLHFVGGVRALVASGAFASLFAGVDYRF